MIWKNKINRDLLSKEYYIYTIECCLYKKGNSGSTDLSLSLNFITTH